MGKNILLIGGGGREHALARSLSESPSVERILCAPGNAGTALVPRCRNLPSGSHADLTEMARRESIDLVVVGPETPLAGGLVDDLTEAGIRCFGPSRSPARLESSKGFAKDFMHRNGVATAAYRRFRSAEQALADLGVFGYPVVVKADGLAAGKGVLICADRTEAESAVQSVMVNRVFGPAGDEIVLEECLTGWETSVIGFLGGTRFLPFPAARDHKRARDGDEGPNTGGMGVVAPHPLVDAAAMASIERDIIRPTLTGLEAEGLGYAGFLFFGVMMTPRGPRALEYNVRFGDPEAQALLPLWSGDLALAMEAALDGSLGAVRPAWGGGASCCVIMASAGYPGPHRTGFPISGIDEAERSGCRVYLAGAETGASGHAAGTLVTTGGRVLGVTAVGKDLEDARRRAYTGTGRIDFDGGWFRRDIGL